MAVTLVAGAVACRAPEGEGVLVLTGRVINGTGAPPVEDGTVIIEGDRIRCVGTREECPLPRGGRHLPVNGGTILPGLIDLHVHARSHYVPWFVQAGVTTIRDANNSLEVVAELEAMETPRLRTVAAGPMIAGTESVTSAFPRARRPEEGELATASPLLVASPEEAERAVDSLGALTFPIDTALARSYFDEARALAETDGGALWGIPLHGPMLFVHPSTRAVVASEPDEDGVLAPAGGVWVGTLPQGVLAANTVSRWGGTTWAMYMWPVSEEPGARAVLFTHELWHRIQPELGLGLSDAANEHLETPEGRAWMRLEWKALEAAFRSAGSERERAIRDALLFREHRRSLFPGSGAGEVRTEVTEGMAEYTAYRLSGLSPEEQRLRLADRLRRMQGSTQSIARPSGYLTGTAYGLLLDDAEVRWISEVRDGFDLAALLGRVVGAELSSDLEARARARAGAYDGDAVFADEDERMRIREERVRAYVALLVEGPVLVLPFEGGRRWSGDFAAATRIEGQGTIWPWIEVHSAWGTLTATRPVLMSDHAVVVPAPERADKWPLRGEGWSLELSGAGWRLEAGERPGDYRLVRDGGQGGGERPRSRAGGGGDHFPRSSGAEGPLPGFAPEAWVATGEFGERSLDSLIRELEKVRQTTVALFSNFSREDWLRVGDAAGLSFSVRALGYVIAGHELHHREGLRARYLEEEWIRG